MGNFGETINNYLDRVVSTFGSRESGDKVHSYFFPFPHGDFQGLEKSSGALMFSLNFFSDITSGDKECNVPLHSVPPKGVFQILVHFGPSRVNRIGGIVGFLHNEILQVWDTRNAEASVVP
jgi:hypothetical protein